MTKSRINSLIYWRLAILASLSIFSTSVVNLQTSAMGKNSYLDFKTYTPESNDYDSPQIIIKDNNNQQECKQNNCSLPETPNPANKATAKATDADMWFPLAIPAQISSPFGWRINPLTGTPHLHEGIDFVAPEGTPVVAAAAGDVAVAGNVHGYGLTVIMRHEHQTRESRYAHLSQILVKPGERVEAGTVIGLVGNTGFSTGPHLHFEWREMREGIWVATDPGIPMAKAKINLVNNVSKVIFPEPEPSLLPEDYRRAPRSVKQVVENDTVKNFPLQLVLNMPDRVTDVLLRRFFRLPEHFS